MMVSSDRPTTAWPFSLNSTGIVAAWAVLMRSMSHNLFRKVLHDGQHGVGRSLPEPAYGCVHHRRGKFLEQRLVPLLFRDQPERLGGAYAAGRALAARLLGEELRQVARRGRRPVLVRKDHHRRRADEAAVLVEGVEIKGDVRHRCGQDAARGST